MNEKKRFLRSLNTYPEFYHRTHQVLKLESQFIKRRIIELTEVNESIRVLDLACGTGRLSHLFCSANQLVSLDLNFSMLEFQYDNKFSGENLIQSNSLKLPFKDCSFNMIILAMNSIAYFSPAEVIVLFKEVNRVLDRDGLFILDQLNPQYLITDESFVELLGSQNNKAYEKIGSKCPDGWRKVTRKYFTSKNDFKEIEELLYFHKLENLRDIALIVGFKTCLIWNGFGKSRVHRNSSRWVFEIRA